VEQEDRVNTDDREKLKCLAEAFGELYYSWEEGALIAFDRLFTFAVEDDVEYIERIEEWRP
jgi:hypothetical protein